MSLLSAKYSPAVSCHIPQLSAISVPQTNPLNKRNYGDRRFISPQTLMILIELVCNCIPVFIHKICEYLRFNIVLFCSDARQALLLTRL